MGKGQKKPPPPTPEEAALEVEASLRAAPEVERRMREADQADQQAEGMAMTDQQLALDYEDLKLRHARLQAAIAAKDDAEAQVRRLTQELATAKRKAREAGWNLSVLLRAEDGRQPKSGKGES